MSDRIYKALAFEKIVVRIFEEAGYKVEENGKEYDFIAEINEEKYCVEVKYSPDCLEPLRQFRGSIKKIKEFAKKLKAKPVLVFAGINKQFNWHDDSQVIIIDICQLLFEVPSNSEIRDELLQLVPMSADEIKPVKSDISLSWLQHNDLDGSLLKRLENCQEGKEGANEYEEICTGILKRVFMSELTLWETQEYSNNGLYRFDLITVI